MVHLPMPSSNPQRRMFGQTFEALKTNSGFLVVSLDFVNLGGENWRDFASPKSSSQPIGMQHPLRRRALLEPKRKLHSHGGSRIGTTVVARRRRICRSKTVFS